MNDSSRYWYSVKNFLGQRRALTWEGWLIDAIWFVTFCLLVTTSYVHGGQHPPQSIVLVFGLIAFFVEIRHWKGEPDRWDD